eukprot:5842200-Pyramimonas_sp.AAC.1
MTLRWPASWPTSAARGPSAWSERSRLVIWPTASSRSGATRTGLETQNTRDPHLGSSWCSLRRLRRLPGAADLERAETDIHRWLHG